MERAAFSLENYRFPEVRLDFRNLNEGNNNIGMRITPSGIFDKNTGEFALKFDFYAVAEGNDNRPCVFVSCEGTFKFTDVHSCNDIPSFFYPNSIAILFPYMRAFVSTVSLQANFQPLILPTMNLSSLGGELKKNIIER